MLSCCLDVGICRLMVPNGISEEDHEKLYTFVETVRGRPYEKNLLSLVTKVTRSRSFGNTEEAAQNARASSRSDSNMTEVFCSELVAAAYRAIGLLSNRAQMELLPKHFDTTESDILRLQRGARLFPPRILPRNEIAEY